MPTEMKKNAMIGFLPSRSVVRIDEAFEEILVSAERYSLGRMTYVVPNYVHYVIPLVPYLSDHCLAVLRDDFESRSKMPEPEDSDFSPWGMEQDKAEWQKLWEAIEGEQERRKAGM